MIFAVSLSEDDELGVLMKTASPLIVKLISFWSSKSSDQKVRLLIRSADIERKFLS